jgi:hypothetical protein
VSAPTMPATAVAPQLCNWNEQRQTWEPVPAAAAKPIDGDFAKVALRQRELIAAQSLLRGTPLPDGFLTPEQYRSVRAKLAMYGDGQVARPGRLAPDDVGAMVAQRAAAFGRQVAANGSL